MNLKERDGIKGDFGTLARCLRDTQASSRCLI